MCLCVCVCTNVHKHSECGCDAHPEVYLCFCNNSRTKNTLNNAHRTVRLWLTKVPHVRLQRVENQKSLCLFTWNSKLIIRDFKQFKSLVWAIDQPEWLLYFTITACHELKRVTSITRVKQFGSSGFLVLKTVTLEEQELWDDDPKLCRKNVQYW